MHHWLTRRSVRALACAAALLGTRADADDAPAPGTRRELLPAMSARREASKSALTDLVVGGVAVLAAGYYAYQATVARADMTDEQNVAETKTSQAETAETSAKAHAAASYHAGAQAFGYALIGDYTDASTWGNTADSEFAAYQAAIDTHDGLRASASAHWANVPSLATSAGRYDGMTAAFGIAGTILLCKAAWAWLHLPAAPGASAGAPAFHLEAQAGPEPRLSLVRTF